jgi:Arc/MetJ-type ribon-helix-helix transcriptional regulator
MITIQLPSDLEDSIRAEVLSGRFASEEELVASAVRDYLRQRSGEEAQSGAGEQVDHYVDGSAEGLISANEQARQELQRRLFEAGVISEIKPPITDLRPYENRRAVPILGDPISETVIRERR